MARVFVLVEDDAGRQTGRGADFAALLGYALRDAGPETWRGTFNLMLPIANAAAEMAHTFEHRHRASKRPGPKTRRPVLHAVLGWHPADLEWLTEEHLRSSVQNALRRIGLAEHQCVWVTHTDTGRPHVHLIANLVHPISGDIARLGLVKKRMSDHCAAYEQSLGDIRCRKRFEGRPANENRCRRSRRETGAEKQKASIMLAPRP